MINKEVKDYIKKELDKGFSLEKIKDKLKQAGYSKEDIEINIPKTGKKQEKTKDNKEEMSETEVSDHAQKSSISDKPQEEIKEEKTEKIKTKKNSPKLILIIILLISIMIGISIITFNLIDKKNNQIEQPESVPEPEKIIVKDEFEIFYENIYNMEFEHCNSRDDIYFIKDFALEEQKCLAYVTDNIALCDKLIESKNDLENRDWCIDGYYLFKKAAFEKEFLCEEMIHEDAKLLCQAIKSKDQSKCNTIQEEIMKICISITSEQDSCNGLSEREQKDCKNAFFLFSTLDQKDIDLCQNLMETDERLCKAIISKDKSNCKCDLVSKQEAFCRDKATEKAEKRTQEERQFHEDHDNFEKGSNKRDISYCEKIFDQDVKDACISIINNDLELCKQTKNGYSKFSCIVQIGEIRKDLSVCNFLSAEEKEDCISYFKSFNIQVT